MRQIYTKLPRKLNVIILKHNLQGILKQQKGINIETHDKSKTKILNLPNFKIMLKNEQLLYLP